MMEKKQAELERSKESNISVTKEQRELLELVIKERRLLLDGIPDKDNDVSHLIDKGYICLVVIEYPWGVDFWLEPTTLGIDLAFRNSDGCMINER
jgi:hypothetical protein